MAQEVTANTSFKAAQQLLDAYPDKYKENDK